MSGAKKDCLTDPNLTRDDSSKTIVCNISGAANASLCTHV